MRLLNNFIYTDQNGLDWYASKGSIIDGASIPKFAWSFIGGPFEGKYRNASVIHDVHCDKKVRKRDAVHEAFYNAMRASNVGKIKASIMYAAVYHFGPRWPTQIIKRTKKENVNPSILSIKNLYAKNSTFKINIEDDYDISFGFTGPLIKTYTGLKKITILVETPKKLMTEKDFKKLHNDIETKNLTLEQIRNYM